MKRILRLSVWTLVMTLWATATVGEELTADQVVEKANEASYYAGADGRADVEMTIKDARGQVRTRKFTILRLDVKNGDQKFFVYFREPRDLYRQTYMVWKHVKGDDDRWLYIPGLGHVKRIAPGDKRTAFVGSDFVYEDVSGRNLNDDTHELVETTDTQYVIKNVPKDPDSVEFAHYTVWIDRNTFLPRKAEYVNGQGELYRRVEALRVETIQGNPTVIESRASDLKAGSSTVNVFSNVKYDIGLKESVFSERFLKRPPREVRSGRN